MFLGGKKKKKKTPNMQIKEIQMNITDKVRSDLVYFKSR